MEVRLKRVYGTRELALKTGKSDIRVGAGKRFPNQQSRDLEWVSLEKNKKPIFHRCIQRYGLYIYLRSTGPE